MMVLYKYLIGIFNAASHIRECKYQMMDLSLHLRHIHDPQI